MKLRFALALGAVLWLTPPTFGQTRGGSGPARVVSLIPAATEIIFAVGGGDRVVGVSTYDHFPARADQLPRVGALLDPNTERILSLRPDLVIVYATQKELMQRLDRAGIPYFSYEHRALADVLTTIRALSARLALGRNGDALATDMQRSLDDIRAATRPFSHPSTLLVFGRDPGSLRNLYASGGFGFLNDLLEIAGGTNVFADVKTQSVQASTEMLLARHPEIIVELYGGRRNDGVEAAKAQQVWSALAAIPAVKNHRIIGLVGDEFVVPGPRLVDAARQLAAALHPAGSK